MVEDSNSVRLLLVKVDVDVVGDAWSNIFFGSLEILNACYLIFVCVLVFGELVLWALCCCSVSDGDKFVGSCASIWSSSKKSYVRSKSCACSGRCGVRLSLFICMLNIAAESLSGNLASLS